MRGAVGRARRLDAARELAQIGARRHLVAPVLDKCAACYDGEHEPLCVSGCPAAALKIGSLADMVREAEGRHCALHTA